MQREKQEIFARCEDLTFARCECKEKCLTLQAKKRYNRMKTLLHKALLYISVYIICAVVLCLVLCNIAYYFIPSSLAYMGWIEAASFVIAAVFVILFVRCRPLTRQEKQEFRFFRFRLR